jgi:short-subunit dehydrogenase
MSNKLALVTGASNGIGVELPRELGNKGYDLIVASAGERLDAASDSLRSSSNREDFEIKADLAARDGVDTLWEQANNLCRPVAIACQAARAKALSASTEEAKETQDIKFRSAVINALSPRVRTWLMT